MWFLFLKFQQVASASAKVAQQMKEKLIVKMNVINLWCEDVHGSKCVALSSVLEGIQEFGGSGDYFFK